MDVLPELGDDGDRRYHRDRALLPLLAGVSTHPPVDAGVDRAAGRVVDEPDLGQALRRAGVLGLIDQGDRAGYVSDRRYGLSRWALQDRRPGDRGLPVEQPWRHRANRSAAHSAGHLGGGIRLRRNRTGGHRGRGNSRTGKDHAARDQLCGVAHRVLLRRVDCPAGPACCPIPPTKNMSARS